MGKKLGSGLLSLGFLGYFIYQTFFMYGSKVTFGPEEDVYYKSGATKEDAQKVGDELKKLGFFTGSNTASVQVVKEDSTYVVRFVIKDEAINDPETQQTFSYIAYYLSDDALNDAKVAVELCDDSLKPKHRVDMKEPPVETEATEGAPATPAP